MNFVSSDIHGSSKRYQELISTITSKDHLYILGDVIDRGNDSIKILKDIIERDNVTLILGNHEVLMLNFLIYKQKNPNIYHVPYDEFRKVHRIWTEYNDGENTLEDYFSEKQSVREKICDYLYNSPIWMKLEINNKKYFLVHAMVPPTVDGNQKMFYEMWNELDYNALYKCVEKRITDFKWEDNNKYYDRIKQLKNENTRLIIGHTPTHQIDPKTYSILKRENVYLIDCGSSCIRGGRVAKLSLETLESEYYK